MTNVTAFFLFVLVTGLLLSCSRKPSEKDISKKILLEYVCAETGKVNDLKILKTEETESTGNPTIFRYTVRGEITWPDGCTEMGTNTSAGAKEKFKKEVTLIQGFGQNRKTWMPCLHHQVSLWKGPINR